MRFSTELLGRNGLHLAALRCPRNIIGSLPIHRRAGNGSPKEMIDHAQSEQIGSSNLRAAVVSKNSDGNFTVKLAIKQNDFRAKSQSIEAA